MTVTTDFDLRERPVVFVAGELDPAPLPRGRYHLIGRLVFIVLAGVIALGALAAVASWSVTGSVGSTDPPRSLWYLPPAATDGAINLPDNHPAQPIVPATASPALPAPPQVTDLPRVTTSDDNPATGGDNRATDDSGGQGTDDGGAVAPSSSNGHGSNRDGSDNGADGNGSDGNGAAGNGSDDNGSDGNGSDDNGSDDNGSDDNGSDDNGSGGNGAGGNGADAIDDTGGSVDVNPNRNSASSVESAAPGRDSSGPH